MKRMRLSAPASPVGVIPGPASPVSDSGQPQGLLPLPGPGTAAIDRAGPASTGPGSHDWSAQPQPLGRVLHYLSLRGRLRLAAVNHAYRLTFRPHAGDSVELARLVSSLWCLRSMVGRLAAMPYPEGTMVDTLRALTERLAWLPWVEAVEGWQSVLGAAVERVRTPSARVPVLCALAAQVRRTLLGWTISSAYRVHATLPFDVSEWPRKPAADQVVQVSRQCLAALTEQATALGDQGVPVMLAIFEVLAFARGRGVVLDLGPRVPAGTAPFDVALWLDRALCFGGADQRHAVDIVLAWALLCEDGAMMPARADAVCDAALQAIGERKPTQRALLLRALAVTNAWVGCAPFRSTTAPQRWWHDLVERVRALPADEASDFATAVAKCGSFAGEGETGEAAAQRFWEEVEGQRFSVDQRGELDVALYSWMPPAWRNDALDARLACCLRDGLTDRRRAHLVALIGEAISRWTRSTPFIETWGALLRTADAAAGGHPDLAATLYGAMAARIAAYASIAPGSYRQAGVELLQRLAALPATACRDDAIGALMPWLPRDKLRGSLAAAMPADAAVLSRWFVGAAAAGLDHHQIDRMLKALDASRRPATHDGPFESILAAAVKAMAQRASVTNAGTLARFLSELPPVGNGIDLDLAPELARALYALALATCHRMAALRASGECSRTVMTALLQGEKAINDWMRRLSPEQRQAALSWLVTCDPPHESQPEGLRLTVGFMVTHLQSLPPVFRPPLLLQFIGKHWGRGLSFWCDLKRVWDAIAAIPLAHRSALLFASELVMFAREPIPIVWPPEEESWLAANAQWWYAMASVEALNQKKAPHPGRGNYHED